MFWCIMPVQLANTPEAAKEYFQWKLQEVSQQRCTYLNSIIETLKKFEICSKLTIKRPKRRQWIYFTPFSIVSIV